MDLQDAALLAPAPELVLGRLFGPPVPPVEEALVTTIPAGHGRETSLFLLELVMANE
jgi:hypothetical protein